MNISIRIYLGFTVLMAIGTGLAGFSIFELTDIARVTSAMDALAENSVRILQASVHIEAIRRADVRYRLIPDEETRAELEDRVAKASALLTEAARVAVSDERRRIFDSVKGMLVAHHENFEKYVHMIQTAATERAKLASGGDALMAATAQLVDQVRGAGTQEAIAAAAADVNTTVLSMRIATWRFLATGDQAGPAAFRLAAERAETALAAFEAVADPVTKPRVTPIRAALEAYVGAFAGISEAQLKSVEFFDTVLRPGAVDMQAKLSAAVTSIAGAYAASSAGTRDTVATTSRLQEVLAGLALALGAVLAFLIGRGITQPINLMTDAMRRLADQDMAVDIPGVGRRDEIGTMAGAVQVFKDNALRARAAEKEQAEAQGRRAAEDERVRRDAEQEAASAAAALVVGSIGTGLRRLAAGDLTFRLEAALPEAYEQLRTDLNSAMAELESLVCAIVANTGGLRSGTAEITQASDDLSRRTEQQAASLEQTAAALDEITTAVRKTADGANLARKVVSQTRSDAEQSGDVVRQAVAAMGSIQQSSQQIGQIIGVIDEIAFQTNLLALNAGVEAARAGEAGRGFTVVASEIRSLAHRSAQAAKEIKTLISTSAQQVDTGVELVAEAGHALARIATQVFEVTAAVTEIAASAQEQAAGLVEVNTAVNQMDQVTQQNAAMVEQSTAASHSLAQETAALVQLTERFQVGAREPAPHGAKAARPRTFTQAREAAPVPMLKVVHPGRGSATRKPLPEHKPQVDAWTEF